MQLAGNAEHIPSQELELKESLHLPSIHEKILITLNKDERLCGSQIIKAFEEATNSKNIITTNSLYPTLRRLEQKKYINYEIKDSHNDKGKSHIKFYTITDKGRKLLENAQNIRQKIESYTIN